MRLVLTVRSRRLNQSFPDNFHACCALRRFPFRRAAMYPHTRSSASSTTSRSVQGVTVLRASCSARARMRAAEVVMS